MTLVKVKSRGTDNVAGRRNLVINGEMRIAQRTTSSANSGISCVDLWGSSYNAGEYAVTTSQETDVPTGNGFINSIKFTITTPETSFTGTEYASMSTFLEARNLQQLEYGTSSAKTSTLSFWVKSSVTGTYGVSIFQNDASRNFVPTYTISSANTWEKKTITIPGDTSGIINDNGGAGFSLYWLLGAGATYTAGSGNNSTWGAYSTGNFAKGHTTDWGENSGATFFLTGVQLEVGDSASDFEFLHKDEILRQCQRYLFELVRGATDRAGTGGYYANNACQFPIRFPVEMRAAPTIEVATGTNYYTVNGNGNDQLNSVALDGATVRSCSVLNTTEASGTAGDHGILVSSNASAYIRFKSEPA